MGSLQWEDIPSTTSAKNPAKESVNNPWFGVTMGLAGIIVGYILANVMH